MYTTGQATEVTGFFRNIELLYCACALLFIVPKVTNQSVQCSCDRITILLVFVEQCGQDPGDS